jgi:hypothetical protein
VSEILPQAPSRWYLTGFLVPLEAGEVQKSDETANDDLDSPAAGGDATDDDTTPISKSRSTGAITGPSPWTPRWTAKRVLPPR